MSHPARQWDTTADLYIPLYIDDGRVTFHCPGLFKAAYTLGGDSPTDQWYLIDFSFDFKGRDGMPFLPFFGADIKADLGRK